MGNPQHTLVVSTLVALVAGGCSRSGIGVNPGGTEGGSGGSRSGGVQSGGVGVSSSGGQVFGGVTGSGGSETPCGCECPVIGPCSCSVCDGKGSGTGGINAFGGVSGVFGSGGATSSSGGVVSFGGISASSGRSGAGGASGSGASSTTCIPPPCAPPVCPAGYVVAPSNDCDCSGPCGCPCGCYTCASAETPDASIRLDAPVSDGPGTAGNAKVPLQHRSTSASCPAQRGPAPPFCAGDTCTSQPYPSPYATACSYDSQCTVGTNGRCFPWEGLVTGGGCSYDECASDANCGVKTPCLCRESSTDNGANVCDVGGNCAVDSDCGPGGFCSPSMEVCYSTNTEAEVEGRNYGWPNPYYCHTPSDLCINDSDCAAPDAGTASNPMTYTPCAYNVQDSRWECTQFTCGLP